MDSYFPTIGRRANKGEYHEDPFKFEMSYPIYPRGTAKKANDKLFANPLLDTSLPASAMDEDKLSRLKEEGKPYFDFRD
jgi:hypothetical protein